MPMATSTGTRRNVAALANAGWGLVLTPDCTDRHGFAAVGIDNGAWGCFQRKVDWTPERWQPLVERHPDARWAVAPDIVCGGAESLARSVSWLPWLLARQQTVLIAVQNGMTAKEIAPLVGPRVGIFVGGDSEWKEQSLPVWGRLAAQTGCYLHVGRVNTARRIRLCAMAGADSFDGTSATKFSSTVPLITNAAAQTALRLDT